MGYDGGNIFFVVADEAVPGEEELPPGTGCGFAEGLKGGMGGFDCSVDVVC